MRDIELTVTITIESTKKDKFMWNWEILDQDYKLRSFSTKPKRTTKALEEELEKRWGMYFSYELQ